MRFKSTGIDFDTGTFRADLQVTAQTVGNVVLTIPDAANVNQEIVLTAATQTLTNKTFSAPTLNDVTLTGTPDASAAVWSDLGQVLTADIDGGTLDSVVVGGASAAAGTFTTLTWTTAVGNITESQISDLGTTVAMVADNLSVFAATTSAQLAGVISDETGSGALVFGTSPTIASATLTDPTITLNDSTAITFGTGSDSTLQWDGTDLQLVTNLVSEGQFKITGAMDVVHTSTSADDHALEIELDAAGYGDVKALDIVYTTGAIAAGSDGEAILINIDKSTSTGGDVAGVEVLATEGSALAIGAWYGVTVDPVVQLAGTFQNMDSALSNAVDVLADFTSTGSDVEIFSSNSDTVTIGNATKFEEIEFLLSTVASGSGVKPTFEYSTGVGTWASFTPTDGTNGLRNNGVIAWLDSDIPSWALGTGSEYLIRITRTQGGLTTPPVEDLVQIAIATQYTWDNNGDLTVKSLTLTTDLAIADGGTGASTAANARTNLGVAIGSDVQAYDAGLTSIAALTTAADKMVYTTASDVYATTDLTAFARTLLDDATQGAMQTTLGVDPAGTDNSTEVTLTGSYDYITILGQVITVGQVDLATDVTGAIGVTSGGTGQTTVAVGDILYGSGVNTWAKLAAGTNGDVLTLAAGVPSWQAAGAPGAHASSHQNGGGDEISVTGLSGLLADDQHVLDTEVIAAVEAEATLDVLALTATSLSVGANDSTQGVLHLYTASGAAVEGGKIKLEIAPNYDTTIQHWEVMVQEDDLRLKYGTSTSLIIRGDSGDAQFQQGVALSVAEKLYFDGGGGNTYLQVDATDHFEIWHQGNQVFRATGTVIEIDPDATYGFVQIGDGSDLVIGFGEKLRLDGNSAGDTYVTSSTANQIDWWVGGGNDMRLEADGDLHVEGDVIAFSTTISSDLALKENIETVVDPIAMVNKLRGVTFDWKKEHKGSSIGVIAQEVEKHFPELVEKHALNGMKTVNYSALIGILIEAVKDLSEKVGE
jgi:hypothetical protein